MFAEEQKWKELESAHTATRLEENKESTSSKVPEKAYCTKNKTTNPSNTLFSESANILEHSKIPSNTGLTS